MPKCGWKPLSSFESSEHAPDKLTSICRRCFYIRVKIREMIVPNVNSKLKVLVNDPKIQMLDINPYISCNLSYFKEHIESLFTADMSWDKLGYFYTEDTDVKYGIHIDHKIPLNAFDLTDPRESFLCFHWKNCQPLWGNENMQKRNTFHERDFREYIEHMKNEEGDYAAFQQIIDHAEEWVDRYLQRLPESTLNTIDKDRQRDIVDDYVHSQCLEGVQVMFFMHENEIHSKEYKATPVALMRNHQSRKSGAENPRSKFVCKLSMDGELLSTYESMNQAAQDNKTFHASISKCCNDPLQLFHAGGFRWCFEHDLISVQQRCRHVVVMRQLCEKIPYSKNDIVSLPVTVPQSHSRTTREKIGETMRQFFETDDGRQNKKEAHKKRSETMRQRREALRTDLREKQCRLCEQQLAIDMFCKKAAAKDGYQPYCKPCMRLQKQKCRG